MGSEAAAPAGGTVRNRRGRWESSATHSETLPPMSMQPSSDLSAGIRPTGEGARENAPAEDWNESPHGYVRPLGPRAARSHSIPVGSRLPAQAAYAAASSQLTQTTGSSSVFSAGLLPPQLGGGG